MRKIDLDNFQVATSETARDINRRIVLNLIRRHQPISRADLARHSGLQRSTVSIIIEQLLDERWLIEGDGHIPRGRRPRFLFLNQARVGIIGINIGPTTTTIALADLEARFIAQETFPTADEPKQFLATLIPRVKNLIQMHPEISCEGIGVSLPGRVDSKTQRLIFAPNLGWNDIDLKTPLEEATNLPVELENAANACALAETWFGRHSEGVQNLVAITVSEGIGAGIILNHQLAHGSNGATGEFGHITLVENGLPCRCGNLGCWEVYASNTAALRYYTGNTPGRINKTDGRHAGQTMTIADLIRLAQHNDPQALKAIDEMTQHLGAGLAQLVIGLAPDVIVVVGEITRLWDRIGPKINAIIKQRVRTHAATRIVPTDPAMQPRLRGTIALVLQKHFGAPVIA